MGRHKLSPEKKRVLIGASIEKKIVDAIGLLQCKEIAEVAVNNKYSEIHAKNKSCTIHGVNHSMTGDGMNCLEFFDMIKKEWCISEEQYKPFWNDVLTFARKYHKECKEYCG